MVTRGTKRTLKSTTTTEEPPKDSRPKRVKRETTTTTSAATNTRSKSPSIQERPKRETTAKKPTPATTTAPKKTTTKKVVKKTVSKPKAKPTPRPKAKSQKKKKEEPTEKEEEKTDSSTSTSITSSTTSSATSGDVVDNSVKDDDFYETEDSDVASWRGWKEIFLVGTEWQNYEQVFKVKWDFEHLHEKLDEPITKKPFDVYLWGTTEPQMVQFKSGRETIVYIPVIIAVLTTHPPPSTVGITSVMREETFVPFKDFKLNWVPYSFSPIFPIKQNATKKGEKPDFYALQCGQRQKAVKSLSETKSTNYSYVLPYMFFPEKPGDEQNTNVNVVTTMDGKGVTFEYDWDMDDFDEVLKEVKEEHGFDDTQMSQIKEILEDEIKKAKQKNKDKKAERKAKIDGMSKEEKDSLKSIQFYKFYPQNTDPKIAPFINPFINRYYGKAHKVFPEIK